MAFAKLARTVRTDGLKTMLLRRLFNLRILSMDEVGTWIERFGNTVRVDGLTFNLDNRLVPLYFKASIVAGWYEKDELEVILNYLPRDVPVIELGASIGIVSCKVNRRLLSPDQHVVVEASPELIPTLKKNRDINRCQFQIVEAALGYDGPTISFFSNGMSLVGNIYHGGGQPLQIPAKTLQAIAENAGFRHFTLISDIEGSEIGLIEHEMDFLREHVGYLFIETHDETPYGDAGVKMVLETIQANDFEMVDKVSGNYCFRNTTLHLT